MPYDWITVSFKVVAEDCMEIPSPEELADTLRENLRSLGESGWRIEDVHEA